MEPIESVRLYPRPRHADQRGWLIKALAGNEEGIAAEVGECYVVQALPRQTRGAHFHRAASEWFTIVQGKARLVLVDPKNKRRSEYALDGLTPVTVFVPAGIAHAFFVDSDDEPAIIVAYADRRYDPSDTVPFELHG